MSDDAPNVQAQASIPTAVVQMETPDGKWFGGDIPLVQIEGPQGAPPAVQGAQRIVVAGQPAYMVSPDTLGKLVQAASQAQTQKPVSPSQGQPQGLAEMMQMMPQMVLMQMLQRMVPGMGGAERSPLINKDEAMPLLEAIGNQAVRAIEAWKGLKSSAVPTFKIG